MAAKKILIVDDEPMIRETLGTLLRMVGYLPVLAGDGNEAFSVFLQDTFDLVLSDIRMPGSDGVELLKKIKDAKPAIPVLLMTGYSDIDRSQAIELGAADLIRKPFSFDSVLAKLESHLKS
jgi:DNA-binding NtrC family response regulator